MLSSQEAEAGFDEVRDLQDQVTMLMRLLCSSEYNALAGRYLVVSYAWPVKSFQTRRLWPAMYQTP